MKPVGYPTGDETCRVVASHGTEIVLRGPVPLPVQIAVSIRDRSLAHGDV
jgi:hypothetical protein